MHIPDGVLSPRTALATAALSAAGLAFAVRTAGRTLPPRNVPLLGLSAAFVFAAQMLNFPVAGGTSGHLIGAVLVGALLGPSAAVIVLSTVLFVQCFLFADGGITALGANIFNMGLVAGVGGWAIYALLGRAVPGLFGRVLAAAFAAWASTVAASITCAGELAASHRVGWGIVLPAMAGVHMLIGVGEAIITGLVFAAVGKLRPELLHLPARRGFPVVLPSDAILPAAAPRIAATAGREAWAMVVYGLLISLGLALFVAPFACHWPDGLDKTAEILGLEQATGRAIPAPLDDYKIPGIGSTALATGLAGAAGTIVMFALAWSLARVLVPRDRPDNLLDDTTAQ